MALKEHENNIITKQYNDPITNYLRNIIQRYFQIENEISQENKEAIIIQAYTRLKEILNAYSNKYIICINERSGNIDLFIRDFGGEEAFDKNTAFNKDFCDVTTESATLWNDDVEDYFNYGEEQEDHIVAGDDDRLSDARIPLAHIHTIDEVKGLREKLEEYNLINGGFHLHTNQNILNMLIYAGSRVSIDLILIEDLVARVEKAVERFKETDEYFISIGQRYINQLQDIFTPIYNKLQYIDNNIDLWISDFVRDANTYTDIKNFSFKQYIHTLLKNYLSNEEFNLLKDALEHSIRVVDSGTISITNANFVQDKIESVNTKTERHSYHNSLFDMKYGYTKLALSCVCNKKITGNVLQNFANNNIINGDLEVFFEYTNDGKHYRDMLPHVYSVNDSQHDFIYADYEIDETNNINVYFKRLSYLPVYLYYPMTLFVWVEDNAGFKSYSLLQIDNSDTSNVDNGCTQSNNTPTLHDSETAHFKIKRMCIPLATQRIHDLHTVTAEYGAGGLGTGPVPGSQGRTGAYKELLVFTARENYSGGFNLSMNTGHWYGFAIWESTDGINFTEVINNYHDSNATHNDSTPLSIPMSSVTFVSGRTYKIITQECDGGGTESDKFVYSFSADNNFAVSVMTEVEVDCDVIFNADKNGDAADLSWTVIKHYETAGDLIGDDPPFNYAIIKNNMSGIPIDCGQNTSYRDMPLDTLPPLAPKITGKCTGTNGSEETYEFTIEASDNYQSVAYKLQISADSSDTLNTGVVCTTQDVCISAYSDIKAIHYTTIMNSFTDWVDSTMYTLISDTDLSSRSKRLVIKKNNSSPFNDRLIFCDNTYYDFFNELQTYLSDFNAHLCSINNTNQEYAASIMLLQTSEVPFYHTGNGTDYYFDGSDVFQTGEDLEWCYYGEFLYGSLNSLFNNATISYRLLTVPGKGEDNA